MLWFITFSILNQVDTEYDTEWFHKSDRFNKISQHPYIQVFISQL